MEIRHLYKSFGEKVIFQDFSVVLPEGKFIALMGASGAGKNNPSKNIIRFGGL